MIERQQTDTFYSTLHQEEWSEDRQGKGGDISARKVRLQGESEGSENIVAEVESEG